nr:hypothetical protein [Tanacetum cinerariifolium]
MSRDVLTVGSTMRIPLLYRGEFLQWVERFMIYLEKQTDGEAMINSIKNGDQPLPRINQVSIAGTSSNEQPPLKDKSMWHMLGSEYGEQDRKLQFCMGDVNDAMGLKKKNVVVTSDPLALIAEKTKVNKSKGKVVVSSDSKRSGFENPRYFEKAKDLRPSLYDEKVIGLRYTSMFLTHSDEALEIEKFKRAKENKIEFAYDYGSLNASYVNEKINFSDDYFQEIINLDFEKIDSPFQQTSSLKPYVPNVILEKIITDLKDGVVSLLEKKANLETIESLKSKGFESSENTISKSENQRENDCHEIEKECDQVENLKVIAPGMFKLSVSQNVSPISMTKTSCASNDVESKLKGKRRKNKSSKQNDKQVNNDVSCANSDFVYFSDIDTFNSVRRPKHSSVI